MTIKQARKILGKLAKGVSDKQLEKDIETVELLKSVFFNQYLCNQNMFLGSTKRNLNMP